MPSPSDPNLFAFAPSELSQDAFICWLLSWAQPGLSERNHALHQTGLDLIQALLEKHNRTSEGGWESVEIRQQYNHMDVVVVLDDETALLIEDKVHATPHSGQLDRYRSTLADEFGSENVLPIYFKTGDQSDFEKARQHGYQPFLREDFLKVLEAGQRRGVQNDILHDYWNHLQSIQQKVESFEATPVGEWPRAGWKGFFQILQDRLDDGSWDYVANPSGGFMGFWWHSFRSNGCRQYLQLEGQKLCFKIAVDDESERKRLREEWHDAVVQTSESTSLPVQKPDRFGYGKHMTVAIVPGDYRVTDAKDIIDIDDTVARLRRAEDVLTLAVESG
jgi:hypothetical protein